MKTKNQILNSGTKCDLAGRIVFLRSEIEKLQIQESEEIKRLNEQHKKMKSDIRLKMKWIKHISNITDPVVLMEMRNVDAILEDREQEMYNSRR